METPRHSEKNKGKTAVSSVRPVDVSDWSKDHVKEWIREINMNKEDAEILYRENMNGYALLQLKQAYILMQSLSDNAKVSIFQHKDLQIQNTRHQNDVVTRNLKPHPFNRCDASHKYRYIENSYLDVTETGPIDLIQPCHEFKAFINTKEEKYRRKKYTYEVIRFAAACMNRRTNGTIHFGVSDKPHGQILGVNIQKTDEYANEQKDAIERHFKLKNHIETAKSCIKPPRFVEVLKADMTFEEKYVLEVDIEPSSIVCKELYFNTYDMDKNEDEKQKPTAKEKKKTKEERKRDKSFFIRDGSSSRNLITANSSKEYDDYIADIPHKNQLRKDAEEKHLSVVKNCAYGSELCEMITGGTHSMDRSYFEVYIVVANKSQPAQLENLDFLLHMKNRVAVLDFDPQSTENGLNKMFNVHSPAFIKFFLCNNEKNPSDADHWLTENGSSVRDVVSFMCQKVQPRKKLLVIFLLFSQVSDAQDPLLETFNIFVQELKGQEQILCISDNETTYTYWKDLIKGRYKADISRCIYKLSFAEVNGTILSLWSENRKTMRFLPCGGGSNVVLSKKTEESLDMLSVLCVNQCEGGNEDKHLHEENFYKGGKVSWWNFFFSEQPGSMPFIKRDKFDYIVNTIIPNILNQNRVCEFFNIYHPPGWGGTTLAMHVLWTLKDKFRCAVLKETTHDYSTVAKQVVQLLTYEAKEPPTQLPVLLMINDIQGISNVLTLQDQIEKECWNQKFFSKSPQVIIVSCMRVESCEQFEGSGNAVSIPRYLSENEHKLFGEKMEEFKKTNTNTETFYVSMMLKTFSSEYIQGIVTNTLKGLNFQDKHAQLFAVLVLLDVYGKNASLSVSTCEEFLGLQTTAESCKVEVAFEKFSSLLKRCTVDSKVTFEGMMVINSSVAQHCLKELSASHGVKKADITNLLLTTESFYKNDLGKQKLMQDVHNILVKKQYSTKDEDFFCSPLIQDIMKETPGKEETVLLNAAKCLREDAVIFQLLARYYYIKKQDFFNDPIKPDSLDWYLKLAESAAEAFKDTQLTADKEAVARLQRQNDYTYNTAGHLSELQTAATVIQILQKISGFTYYNNNHLTQVLLGKITIEDLSRKKPELKQYCDVLQKHKHLLLQLKSTMKQHFDFFKKQFVNLVPFFAEEDKQKKQTMCKISSYFKQYTGLFLEGKTLWIELFINNHLSNKVVIEADDQALVKIEQTREYLEWNKGDSYTGLLEYLYTLHQEDSTLEQIIRQYKFIIKSQGARPMDTVNFIYANVILANINHASRYITPYQDLCKLLFETITPAGEKTITPAGEQTLTPAGEQTITPAGEQTLTPAGEQTLTPAGEQTLTPAGEQTLTPAGEQTITPAGEQTLTPAGEQTITPAGEQTLTPAGEQTLTPASEQTLTPAGEQTLTPAGEQTILPLHYITVLLFWQEKNSELPTFVSKMKESYSKDLKPLSNGKRAAIHFYLGKDKGYGGLISHRDINSWLGSGQNISTQWNSERIWKQVRDSEKLCRVSGEIRNNLIWVADVKCMIDPMFKSQLRKESGTRVTFFIGFSMNGPVALDIDFES